MPRQVLPVIDLRSQAERQGITRTQETVQSIANILQTLGQAEKVRRDRQTLDRITRAIASGKTNIEAIAEIARQGPEFGTGFQGGLQRIGGLFQPQGGGIGQSIQQAIIGQTLQQALAEPLEKKYLKARIKATKALTKQRQETTKQALPDRMLRQADRWLRIVDDVMSEYWYTPEGPYRDKLLKDAQRAREKAVKLIEKYGATSEAGKASLQQLENLDEEIKKAGGEVKAPVIKEPKPTFVVDKYPRPKTKEEFDNTLLHISSEEEKDRYFEKHWRPEFGR